MSNPKAPTQRAVDFLLAVTRPVGSAIELRALSQGGVIARSFCRNRGKINQFLSSHSHCNLYFGVASRLRDASDGSLLSCQQLASLFCDIDFKATALAQAKQALADFAMRPSAIISSGGGLHCYWSLDTPVALLADADRTKAVLRKLAIRLNADLSAAEPARILRVPGTFNYKYNPPRSVEVLEVNSHKYSLIQFEQSLAEVADQKTSSTSYDHDSPSRAPRPSSSRIDFTRIANGLSEGERDWQLFRLACSLRRRGYSREQTTAIVIDAAIRCVPPFPRPLAEQKVGSAWSY
jgi:hypothetical protein